MKKLTLLLLLFANFATAQLNISNNINVKAPYDMDFRRAKIVNGVWTPFASVAEANAANNINYRAAGLTVLINTGGGQKEYWYDGCTSDTCLKLKTIAASGGGALPSGGAKGQFLVKTSAADGAATWQTKEASRRVFYPEDFGAKSDRHFVEKVTVTENRVVTVESVFSAGDVGKQLKAFEGKVNGQTWVTSITGFVSDKEVTVAGTLPTYQKINKGIVFGTNSLPAIRAMIDAGNVPDALGRVGGVIKGAGYILAGAVDPSCNCLIKLPVDSSIADYASSPNISAWEWDGESPFLPGNYGYFTTLKMPQQGAIIESFNDTDTGFVFGTAKTSVGYAGLLGSRSALTLKNMTIRTIDGSSMGGVNGYDLFGGLFVDKLIVDVDKCVVSNDRVPTASGIVFPQLNNGCWSRANDLMVYGYNHAIAPGEHFMGGYLAAYGNRINLFVEGSGHTILIDKMISQAAQYAVWTEGASGLYMKIGLLDIERNSQPGQWYDAIADVHNASFGVQGEITIAAFPQGLGDFEPIVVNEAPGLKINSLRALGAFYDERSYNPVAGLRYREHSMNASTSDNGLSRVSKQATQSGVNLRFLSGTSSFMDGATKAVRLTVHNPTSFDPNAGTGSLTGGFSPNKTAVNWYVNMPGYASTSEGGLFVGNAGSGTVPVVPAGIGLLSINTAAVVTAAGGFVFPKMTKTERNALTSVLAGTTIFQTDNTPGLRVWNGTSWMMYSETAD